MPPLTPANAVVLRARWETLSARQQQVALLVINENLTNNQVAQRLVLSLNTVKSHLSAVYASLGVENRLELRLAMLFTKYLYELLENQPAASGEEETPSSPPAL